MSTKTIGTLVSANAKVIGCIQSVGNIKLDRSVKEYTCLTTGDVELAIANIKAGDIPITVKYDPADAAGAGEMEASFLTGVTIPFSVELSNTLGVNGTTFSWDGAAVTSWEIQPEDEGFVLAVFTVKLNGEPTILAAA